MVLFRTRQLAADAAATPEAVAFFQVPEKARRLSDRCWLCGQDAVAIIYQGWLHGSHR
jgi:hypothetical protein